MLRGSGVQVIISWAVELEVHPQILTGKETKAVLFQILWPSQNIRTLKITLSKDHCSGPLPYPTVRSNSIALILIFPIPLATVFTLKSNH